MPAIVLSGQLLKLTKVILFSIITILYIYILKEATNLVIRCEFESLQPPFLFRLCQDLEDEDVVGAGDDLLEGEVDERTDKHETVRHRFA